MLGASQDMSMEIIEHEGKRYRRVQIEGQDGDHLMDEEANIYTLDFQKIGCAGDSDDDWQFREKVKQPDKQLNSAVVTSARSL